MVRERVPTEQIWPSYMLVSCRCRHLKWTQVVGLCCSGACIAEASLGSSKPLTVVGLRFVSVSFEGLALIVLECRAVGYGEAIYLTRAEVMEDDEGLDLKGNECDCSREEQGMDCADWHPSQADDRMYW